jgi:hypothetical protein
LDVRIPGGAVRSNSLPSGHTDLNRRHLALEEDLLEGVLVTKVPSASFGLEVIKDKTTEDVERLFEVGEAADALHDSFTEKHERPRGGEAHGRFAFIPYSLVGVPHALGHGAFE